MDVYWSVVRRTLGVQGRMFAMWVKDFKLLFQNVVNSQKGQ